jgi:hypothetical protein
MPEAVIMRNTAGPALPALIAGAGHEFDLGPDGAELMRALVRKEDANQWSDAYPRNICWDNAARSGQTRN